MPAQCTSKNSFYNSCCKAGEVKVDYLREPPAFLKDLYDNQETSGKQFRSNIRWYNSLFAFSSIRCEAHNASVHNMPVQIHGTMYHIQGPLETNRVEDARYSQLYLYDPNIAAAQRHSFTNSRLNATIIRNITLELHEVNPLVTLYRSAYEMLADAARTTTDNVSVRIAPSMNMELIGGRDRRTQNLPTSNEVAMVVSNETSDAGFRDVRIYLRNSNTEYTYTTISQNHALYMPSHYTLMFPHGDMGWNWGLRLEKGEDNLEQLMYYRFRLHQRANEYPIIFKASRLFQQYLVDIWAVCDQNKLNWFRTHQKQIRADLYGGLEDALINADIDGNSRGRTVLPSSHTGGPRFMAKLYQNSMAIVRHLGKPSLFITFTANPNWSEITSLTRPLNQTASDRPDLVARVFNLKVKELLKDIKERKIFGSYKGLVRTVEYQKRGLPHVHILLFLDPARPINTREDIDEVISAEIPSKQNDPVLHEIVTRCMGK